MMKDPLFSWNEIPGKDNNKLLEFLKNIFANSWINTANPEKIDQKTIKVSTETNFILLKLNDEETNVDTKIVEIKIDDGRIIKICAQRENSELKVYDSIAWDLLLHRIDQKTCTPFLGSEVCDSFLTSRSDIAQKWATEHGYPLKSSDDLTRVALFLAIKKGDTIYPKNMLKNIIDSKLRNIESRHFKSADEIHGVLAKDLPFKIYITTNYDDLMERALKALTIPREPIMEICRWNKLIKDRPSIFETEQNFDPSVANPVVFHLHGHKDIPESMVLTSDDYLDFLIEISKDPDIIKPIEKVFTSTSLLFLGYRIEDIDFQILLRLLNIYIQKKLSNKLVSIAVQLAPCKGDFSRTQMIAAQEYLSKYFEASNNIYIYWGSCRDFAKELKIRWESYEKNKTGGL